MMNSLVDAGCRIKKSYDDTNLIGVTLQILQGGINREVHMQLQVGSRSVPSTNDSRRPFTFAKARIHCQAGRECDDFHLPQGVEVRFDPRGNKCLLPGVEPDVEETEALIVEQRMPIFDEDHSLVVRANYGIESALKEPGKPARLDSADFELVTLTRDPNARRRDRGLHRTISSVNLRDIKTALYYSDSTPLQTDGILEYTAGVDADELPVLRFCLERSMRELPNDPKGLVVLTRGQITHLLDSLRTADWLRERIKEKDVGKFPQVLHTPENVRKLFSRLVIDMLVRDGKIF